MKRRIIIGKLTKIAAEAVLAAGVFTGVNHGIEAIIASSIDDHTIENSTELASIELVESEVEAALDTPEMASIQNEFIIGMRDILMEMKMNETKEREHFEVVKAAKNRGMFGDDAMVAAAKLEKELRIKAEREMELKEIKLKETVNKLQLDRGAMENNIVRLEGNIAAKERQLSEMEEQLARQKKWIEMEEEMKAMKVKEEEDKLAAEKMERDRQAKLGKLAEEERQNLILLIVHWGTIVLSVVGGGITITVLTIVYRSWKK